MSASADDCVIKVSIAMMLRAPEIPRRAKSASGTSESGSAPSRIKHSILPDAAASRISAVDFPPLRGVRPAVIAPRTLPRRNTGSTVACGAIWSTSASACTTDSSDSAKFIRPTMTTTEPLATCAVNAASVASARNAAAVLPGST